MREDAILEHEIVRDRHRNDEQVGTSGGQRRLEQSGLGELQLAAVAAPAFRIEEQVVLLENLRDIRLQRDEVRRVFGVAANRNRAGDVLVEQPERSAEKIDAGGDERRSNAVVVEHERFDEVVGVALVIRRVDDAVRPDRVGDVMELFVMAFDLAEDGKERMLQRAVNRIPLRRAQLVEIPVNSLASLRAALAVPAAQVLQYFRAREHGL